MVLDGNLVLASRCLVWLRELNPLLLDYFKTVVHVTVWCLENGAPNLLVFVLLPIEIASCVLRWSTYLFPFVAQRCLIARLVVHEYLDRAWVLLSKITLLVKLLLSYWRVVEFVLALLFVEQVFDFQALCLVLLGTVADEACLGNVMFLRIHIVFLAFHALPVDCRHMFQYLLGLLFAGSRTQIYFPPVFLHQYLLLWRCSSLLLGLRMHTVWNLSLFKLKLLAVLKLVILTF